eukprot:IDg2616t1
MRDALRHLFNDIERLRNSTIHAAKTDDVSIAYITRAKLLAAVSGIDCFQHVRANPPEEYLRLRNALYDATTQEDTLVTQKHSVPSLKQTKELSAEAFLTDRRFRGNRRGNRKEAMKFLKNSNKNVRYAGNSND